MRFAPRAVPALAATAAAAVLVAGCGSSGAADPTANGAAADPTGGPASISVVTSTNVYASIATTIGGDAVQVSAILSDPAADPHSFEVSAQDQVKIAKAQLVIANGGGYDDFAQQMVDAADPRPQLLDAVQISGLDTGDSDHFNEHVFYDLDAMTKLGNAIAGKLAELDPAGKATFDKNAADFTKVLAALKDRAAGIGAAHPGVKAVVTEPVADYLLASAGISDVTPGDFAEAIEQENDPAPGDIAQVDALLAGGTVSLVVFNSQTAGPVTERLETKAQQTGIPVLKVTETLPAGVTDYADWIGGTLDALSKALG
ncbi:metal ABC transporter solute-binding protein, Zn/Mn family [Nakamurella lactea]|uniref:metal ABC transporter solute-binding protein, Zn/Mn family n=1 Tax=Nakamurella lactea TaxID=459515 RepID=UPI0004015DD1|nr:zinc ABC transporter substrate-binding protein [Nakamurella lactea]